MQYNTEIYILSKLVRKFCEDLINELRELKRTLKSIGINVDDSIPEPFNGNFIDVKAYYSYDRKQHFIMFNKSRIKDEFNFSVVTGNPIPIPILNFTDESDDSKIINLSLQDDEGILLIEYSLIIPQPIFGKKMDNIKEYAAEIVKINLDTNKFRKQEDQINHLKFLLDLKQRMEEIFFNETVSELTIDKFIEENPIILEEGLNLVNPRHQVKLKNVLGKYEHDLKPDLIAFDLLEKNWVIVDYKKAKRKIIKNLSKVRTGFKAEVNDLKNQLLDYVEYFAEKEHRDYVLKTYHLDINYPNGIGIIGNVNYDEQKAFSRLIHHEPKWYKVVPYNYLYDNFCRYIVQFSKQLK
ncbi:DUF4263 domain-containing protein [Rossellomorea marisflavi]|uniref:DUF4263 domain-containing protein n=1 Tax=Rossellomorea marisflavi TaxID=189381 RepID=A0A5D4S196_9BACI|nr:DUF4263 domain-containing protein [Rossellomorea marisflavi]TYS56990.1 DUF4263 domain-containing protein [Rossellomorea marisflavi]